MSDELSKELRTVEETAENRRELVDDLEKLIAVIPTAIRKELERLPNHDQLVEIVLDLGRRPEARYTDRYVYLGDMDVTSEDLDYVLKRIGSFGPDNRAGIERTLHRISCIRNRQKKIVGLTCRVGRAVYGTIDIIRDVIESGKSTLLLGRPGVGKTTMLREVARVLADEFDKRVVIVDTSNEIAGDGDVPHPAIGRARRMQVPYGQDQADVMIEAVENHMPEVIVIDEIGTEAEAQAARTIAERGVQLIGTAHGNTLSNLVMNPTLSDLVGGIQVVTLSDEEARKRGTQKTVLERKAPPTFSIVIEIQDKDTLAIHPDVAFTVDMWLRGIMPDPEVRRRKESGGYEVIQTAEDLEQDALSSAQRSGENPDSSRPEMTYAGTNPSLLDQDLESRPIHVFPYGVSRNHLKKAADKYLGKVLVVNSLEDADLVVTIKGQYRKMPKKLKEAELRGLPVEIIRSNTYAQVARFIERLSGRDSEELDALVEAERAVRLVQLTRQPQILSPQNAYIRKLQHGLVEKAHLHSDSVGEEPHRSVRIFPPDFVSLE